MPILLRLDGTRVVIDPGDHGPAHVQVKVPGVFHNMARHDGRRRRAE